MHDYWECPDASVPFSAPKLKVNGLPYDECTKEELAEEIRKHRQLLHELREIMNTISSAQQRVPYELFRY